MDLGESKRRRGHTHTDTSMSAERGGKKSNIDGVRGEELHEKHAQRAKGQAEEM